MAEGSRLRSLQSKIPLWRLYYRSSSAREIAFSEFKSHFTLFSMRHIRLHYTGAAFFFLLFSARGAEPYSLLKVLERLQAAPQNYPSPLYSFSLCMEINNRVFSDTLLNTNSQQYQHMYAEVAGVLDIAFNCSDCDTRETYRGVTNIQFSNGSVIANCTIQFQTIFINHVVIKHLFLRAVDNNTQLNGLAVNRQYTAETVKPAWLFPKSSTPLAETSVQGLPGWAIALLVLACIIILLLLIILLLICFWCCRRKAKKEETQTVAPYERTSFKEHLANPTYMSHTPERSPNYRSLGEPEAQPGNQSGIYMNPQR
ncbi:mucin-1-like [Sinocyclocheilus anshuiensis]|uniref:mucin-1-like n=1 Tax=Sinocyclocheilus anshuiensis TaxID=1608454 RepID=UPI0007B8CCD2|nr:PREDICTED: mucin-1-like [Sinocyclocheilus anshuiensis]